MPIDVTLLNPPPLEGSEPVPARDFFGGALRTETTFAGPSGVRKAPPLTPSEIQRIKELVKDKLALNAREMSAAAEADLRAIELERYHEVADRYPHDRLLSKRGRILGAEAVAEIKAMSFFDYVRDAVGAFCLSDEDGIGHEQVCMRIVRPNRREDVGTLHRDSWFWEYYGWPVPAGTARGKAWVAVAGDTTRAGLLLAVNSHSEAVPYKVETGERVNFVPRFDPSSMDLRRFTGELGQPVLFNYQTLHVGPVNRSNTCRVSIEVTILFKDEAKARVAVC